MTHVHVDLGAYVLGALEPGEQEQIRAHLAECSDCSAAYAELEGLPRLLDLAVVAGAGEEDPLPPAIEERVLDRFARERSPEAEPRRRWRPRLVLGFGGALAGAAAAVALLIAGFGFRAAPTARYGLALQPMGTTPVSATAQVGLRSVQNGTRVLLRVRDLPTRPGDVYEVLCSNKKWTASAGTFRVDAQGNAYVVLTTAAKRGAYDRIVVVRRSAGAAQAVPVLGARLD
jgi:predicted anti-sigma-YlaC factor YlaD